MAKLGLQPRSPCFPHVRGFLSSTAPLFLHATARGLRRTFEPSPFRVISCCLRCALKPSASATNSSRSCTSSSSVCASPLRPTGYSVYASPALFAAFRRLRHGRKTRYGWVASRFARRGLSPRKKRWAYLSAITTPFSPPRGMNPNNDAKRPRGSAGTAG